MKKLVAILITLLMVLTIFAGCTNKTTEQETNVKAASQKDTKNTATKDKDEEKDADPVTINFAIWTDNVVPAQAIIDQFEKLNSNIKVNMLEYPSKEHQQKLTVQLAGGGDIDVFATQNTSKYADFAARDQMLALDDLVKRDKFDVSSYGASCESLRMNGNLYGLPFRKTTWALYYNKDLFDAAGVEYPSQDMTWDEYRALAKQMTKGEGNDKIWGAYTHTWPQCWYGPALQTGATVIDEDLTPFISALQLRLDMEQDGSIMTYVDSKATNTHYKTEFAKGKTAMHIIGDWHIGQLRLLEDEGTIDFDWDVVPVPHNEGGALNTTWGMATPVSINAKSKYIEESWEFLKYFAGQGGATIFAEYGAIPGYSSQEIQELFIGNGERRPANIGIFPEQNVYSENPAIVGAGTVKSIFEEEAQIALIGERSVVDTIAEISRRVQKELNK